MSLYAYCKKSSSGNQNYICSKKCVSCVIYIAKTRAIWQERFYLENEIQ